MLLLCRICRIVLRLLENGSLKLGIQREPISIYLWKRKPTGKHHWKVFKKHLVFHIRTILPIWLPSRSSLPVIKISRQLSKEVFFPLFSCNTLQSIDNTNAKADFHSNLGEYFLPHFRRSYSGLCFPWINTTIPWTPGSSKLPRVRRRQASCWHQGLLWVGSWFLLPQYAVISPTQVLLRLAPVKRNNTE